MVELLSPAGNMECLRAAVNAGCDAVYFGATSLNARAGSKNFLPEEIEEAARLCRLFDVKSYLTLNTIVSDNEIINALPLVKLINEVGIDAVIVQDIGLAQVLRQCAPDLPIHASTQLTIHNLRGVLQAKEQGFSRVVVSRELPQKELANICTNSPLEIEAFIHGALCMCYSGQCYFSSVIGSRSGNRGKCAQPCRQAYKNGYELSLKDLSLASRFTDFLATGVTSLKIEGRLKSPEYVAGVTAIYRRLIDENRNATPDEMDILTKLFSRQGFTNAYFEDRPSKKMFGIRTQADKDLTESYSPLPIAERKMGVSFKFEMKIACPVKLTAICKDIEISLTGNVPEIAQNRETTIADIEKQLRKTGGTPFSVEKILCDADKGLIYPISALNSLRREALDKLMHGLSSPPSRRFCEGLEKIGTSFAEEAHPIFQFQNEAQLKGIGKLADRAKILWLPMEQITENHFGKTGAVLPSIVFDRELPSVKARLEELKKMGIKAILCRTYGQIRICKEMGLEPHADTSNNLFNSYSLDYALKEGFKSATLSWECNLSQIRDIKKPLPTNIIVYGRLPLMTTQNCIIKNSGTCINEKGYYILKDKTGAEFPVICTIGHRNQILNAHPIYLADKLNDFASLDLSGFVYNFTLEKPEEIKEIIQKYNEKSPSHEKFTRGLYYKKI